MSAADGGETLASAEVHVTERGIRFSIDLGYGIPAALIDCLEGVARIENLLAEADTRLAGLGHPGFKKEIEKAFPFLATGAKTPRPE
ncbi:MAG: hypothetical protein A3F26_02510 [Candidatus Ryanbacteria bacterium RIFCSPHIGHO2_12_FULL_47_12b]|uniref:Uncharacterized protein n=2 Tax=Candidatus Ryaniibacteriota TaxID=1817914 RepID=A0A1G2H4Q9_9BACT|nr:MAG: hypothetical protein UX74_C0015G0036 [Parcubacteria group bacterium GW2011_GWA2_47_10b]KKU86391.1 MAG: hypothetical protein UY14_C0002G0033 [Parcubacteria group bacterium GW2011_GWA1_47_9]OGZ44384.1 MAG: hypothetical protein A2844_01595 [Candidatus Ryanbacteria bacterium RIFCSPHIGHO2_01_FULL_48_80]OGZ48021.1 MAG: hypothetical protein A3C83_01405 [Candidatus Ryanbacteria bacterium RIFCSPHIGHO2_02_FULL_47_25]OGZ52404.1 MAG: hypothetical protein A3F26_02510 [Candidatus Ryanbacteria bacteri